MTSDPLARAHHAGSTAGSAREAAKAGDILPLAASFEAWLTRPLGEAEA